MYRAVRIPKNPEAPAQDISPKASLQHPLSPVRIETNDARFSEVSCGSKHIQYPEHGHQASDSAVDVSRPSSYYNSGLLASDSMQSLSRVIRSSPISREKLRSR
jgi:hypothetical protein